ncbi:MAG: hypothetical protein NT062_18340 [Proteobacteria bacterium]|nr:hypothetical protein [Pseudomonadota bacterium]
MLTRFVSLVGFGLALVASTTSARADKLGEARAAIEAVRYEDAQPLLVAALQEGGKSPTEVAELYRMSASTAIVLGQQDVAEQYYRRWLALVPTASLPDTIAPKLRAPFVAAQASMAARGRLVATARIHAAQLDVIVESDPLAMVATIAVGTAAPRPLGADHAAHFDTTGDDVPVIFVRDEFGNHLLELGAADVTRDAAPIARPTPPSARPSTPSSRQPIYANPIAWAVPTLALVGFGVGFSLLARDADATLADQVAHPAMHFYSDATVTQQRRDRDALYANLSYGLAGAVGIVGLVLVVTHTTPVTIAPTPGGATAALSLRF